MTSAGSTDWSLLRVGFFFGIFFLSILQLALAAVNKNVYAFTLYIAVLSLVLTILAIYLWKLTRKG